MGLVHVVVRRAMTGHVTERMQQHYSSVDLRERREAVVGVLRLVQRDGDTDGYQEAETKKAGN